MAINDLQFAPFNPTVPQIDFTPLQTLAKTLQDRNDRQEAANILSTYYNGGQPPAAPQQDQGFLSGLGRLFGMNQQATPATTATPVPAAPSDYAARTAQVESGNNPVARNPNSSASGPYQFTNSTWLENFDKAYPNMAQLPSEQKLAIKDNPNYRPQQDKVFQTLTANNEGVLQSKGIPIDNMSRYAAHFFGPGDAAKVLTSEDSVPLENVVSPASLQANPFLQSKTVGQAREWLNKQMASTPQAPAGAGYEMSSVGAPPGAGMPANLRAMLPQMLANPKLSALGTQLAAKYANPESWSTSRDSQGNIWQTNNLTGERKIIDKSNLLTPEEFRQKMETNKAGATNVTLQNMSGDNSYDTVVNKGYGELFNDMQKSGRDAVSTTNTLKVMRGITEHPNFDSGLGGEIGTQFKKGLVRLGISDADKAAPNELFQKLSQRAIIDAAGGSLSQGVSNADRNVIQGTVANIANTPEGNRTIIDVGLKLEQRKQDVAKMARQYAKTHGGRIDAGFDDELATWAEANPLFPNSPLAKQPPQQAASGGVVPPGPSTLPPLSDIQKEIERRQRARQQ